MPSYLPPQSYLPAPTPTQEPTQTPASSSGGGFDASSIIGGAAGLALTPILGPFAPLAGGALGSLFGGGGAKAGGDNGGLQSALTSGVGSLFPGGGKSTSSSVTNQTVTTNQGTSVNVQNILGGRPFGNYNAETGDFDTFQALSDVFAIKSAQDQARLAGSVIENAVKAQNSTTPTTKKPLNFLPLIVVGGTAAAFFLLRRK